MKWKFGASVAMGCVLAIGAASGIRLFGQQNGNQNSSNRQYSPGAYSNPGSQMNNQLLPGQMLPGQLPPGMPYPIGPEGQRMVPYSYTSRSPDGREVTNTVMRTEEWLHRLNAGHQVLREAQAKLRSADATDSDKKEARESIAKYLKEEFERDQKARREQVERLEEQVARLRKQLDKRQESQSKIIELRMQLLENEAEGLAFPESFNELGAQPHGYAPGPFLPIQPNVTTPSSTYPAYAPAYPTPYPQTPNGFGQNPGYPQSQQNSPQQKPSAPKENQERKATKPNDDPLN